METERTGGFVIESEIVCVSTWSRPVTTRELCAQFNYYRDAISWCDWIEGGGGWSALYQWNSGSVCFQQIEWLCNVRAVWVCSWLPTSCGMLPQLNTKSVYWPIHWLLLEPEGRAFDTIRSLFTHFEFYFPEIHSNVNLVSVFQVSVFEDSFPWNCGTDIFQIILIIFGLFYGLSDLLTYKCYVYLGLLDFVSVDRLSV